MPLAPQWVPIEYSVRPFLQCWRIRRDSCPRPGCDRMSMENALASLIGELEQNRSLDELRHLRQRIEVLDDLDAYLPDGQPIGTALHHRARAIYAELESVNFRLYEAIRRDIQRGAGGGRLLEWMPDWPDWNGRLISRIAEAMTIWTN